VCYLFFSYYIKKAVSQIGNVVITIKPFIMDKIIEKYYISPGSVLVNYNIGKNGVDCWFDTDRVRQHRCLSLEDFNILISIS
jgi:hypothetical protein